MFPAKQEGNETMGALIVAAWIFYFFLCLQSYHYVCKKTESKRLRRLTILVLILIATWDNIIGLSTYYYLCVTQGGQKIYKTVENAEGYFDTSGRYGFIGEYPDLIDGKYKFVEVEVTRDLEQEAREQALSQRREPLLLPNGKYRFYLAKAGAPHCEYYSKDRARFSKNDPYYGKFPEGSCMAIEKIDSFKSRYVYRYRLDADSKVYGPRILNIAKQETSVRDMQTGEILGVARSFYYWGGWIGVWINQSPVLEYPEVNRDKGEKSIDMTLLNKVLKSGQS
jgi:hypothetical protein